MADEENDDLKVSDEELEALVEALKQAMDARKDALLPPPLLPPEPIFEPETEREEALFQIVQAAALELEELKRRVSTLEELILLEYRSKNTRSH